MNKSPTEFTQAPCLLAAVIPRTYVALWLNFPGELSEGSLNKKGRYTKVPLLAILRQGEGRVPIVGQSREQCMSNAFCYSERAKHARQWLWVYSPNASIAGITLPATTKNGHVNSTGALREKLGEVPGSAYSKMQYL